MKKLLVMAATLAASSAFAGVKLEVRSDYLNVNKYDQADGNENGGVSIFAPTVARLYLNGNVGEAIVDSGWNLRAFTPVATVDAAGDGAVNQTMTVDKFVDHLWIGKAMNGWMFKAGKLETNAGGFEHQKDVHGDTYLVSMANGGAGGVAETGSAGLTGYVVNPGNASGISAAYNINADNKLEVQITNQTNSGQGTVAGNTNLTTSTDRRQNMGLNWTGSFMEKMIQTNVGYIVGAADTTTLDGLTGTSTGEGHEQTFINAGIRVAPMAALTIDVEYFSNTDKNSTADTTQTVDSTIVEARYTVDGWTPVLKYEMSNSKDKDAATNSDWKRTAFAAAVEYAPKADEAFRYHIAYTSVQDKDFGVGLGGDDMTRNLITVGLKYTGDIVK